MCDLTFTLQSDSVGIGQARTRLSLQGINAQGGGGGLGGSHEGPLIQISFPLSPILGQDFFWVGGWVAKRPTHPS